jgi:two-component system nitrogen regulation response regulator NtrX
MIEMVKSMTTSGPAFLGRVVLIDDEPDIRATLGGVLADEGYDVQSAGSISEGLELVQDRLPDLCFLDVWLPDGDGIDALGQIRKRSPSTQIIMISGHSSVEAAVKATQLGAVDFLEKPLGLEKVLLAAQNALKLRRLTEENETLRSRAKSKYQLIGESQAIREISAQIQKVARTQATVLITGENGTGKENVSRAIHYASTRREGPFVAINCAAIPEELIESELFGHEKGAFTGAGGVHRGRFEVAHRGTLFLDEIGDMSLKTQSKLLRVLQDQSFERVGGNKSIVVDVRVIAATNKDLRTEIEAGRFREDLFYRLNVIPLHLPALRERHDDIILLAKHFLSDYCRENGEPEKAFDALAEQVLLNHGWPGNVRELKNLMERVSILVSGRTIGPQELGRCGLAVAPGNERETDRFLTEDDFRLARAAFERAFIARKLEQCGGSVSKTAERIGMERTHLHRKLKQLELEVEDRSDPEHKGKSH